jgi:hypothetical protein
MQLKPRLVIPQITDTPIEHPQGMHTQNNSPSCNVTNLVLQSMLILQALGNLDTSGELCADLTAKEPVAQHSQSF